MSPNAVIRLREDREQGIGVSSRVELGTQGQRALVGAEVADFQGSEYLRQ